jgi:hypothetical protein
LPGSTSQAQTDALSYVTKNGLNTANTTIGFTCTSQNPSVCTTGSGTYDTIVVTQKAPSPIYLGGILSILGISKCWVTGCTSSATAVGTDQDLVFVTPTELPFDIYSHVLPDMQRDGAEALARMIR